MPKFDPSFLPPVPVAREVKTFTTKSGQSLTFTAVVQDGGDFAYALMDKHTENLEKWASGVPVPAAPSVKITNTLCWMITRPLLVIVPGDDEEESDLWGFSHWAILASRDEKCFSAISSWASSIGKTQQGDGKTQQGDEDPTTASPPESKGDADHSSPAPSTTPDDTPT